MGMREKKKYRIISFHTTTEAIAMEKKCGKMHIPGRLIPTPREISASCGLAWRMTAAKMRTKPKAMGYIYSLSFHKSKRCLFISDCLPFLYREP